MYAAILKSKLVLAISEANLVHDGSKRLNFEKYICPSCKKPVILIISQEKTPFFKHIRLIKGTGEKEEHQQSKQLLCTSLIACGYKAAMEVPLANQQLRADVFLYPSLSFEIQCAPLSDKEFNHRHHLYEGLNIKDVWIVGKRHYLKKKLKKSQRIFLRYSQTWDWYYLEINPFSEKIILKYQIRLQPIVDNVMYRKKVFELNERGIFKLFNFKAPSYEDYLVNFEGQKKYLKRQIRQKSIIGQKIASLMYERGLTLEKIPDWVFMQVRLPDENLTILNYLQKNRCH